MQVNKNLIQWRTRGCGFLFVSVQLGFFCLNTFKYGDKIINNQCNFIIFAIGFNKS